MNKTIYLLDTNIISEMMKPVPNKNVAAKINEKKALCAISSTTWNELIYGLNIMPDGKKKDYIFDFIVNYIQSAFPIINFDNHTAWIQGDIRSRLRKIGRENAEKNSLADTEIAAAAISNQLILVTRNTKHFESIKQVDSVFCMENWFEE